ncbi:hypothetical protein P389DRAFT_174035 [Cystobasidium minutum MCA 4210]|uniref:uncharacterized protein n=1 Tax=Cystobasidium minutum MCA 4210 TaxID=1397322 RepID=UPI0034CDED3F|eukprot:jgi/Rhomi1/174035/fgenesh1_kg.7_\
MAVKGREAALRDIEREMALDEVLEDGEGDEDCVSDDDDEESKQVPPQRSQHQQDKQHQIQDRAPAGTSLPDDDKSTSTITINASNTQRIAGSAPLPTSSDKALPMSPPDLVEQDLRRRSQYRTPGLATSPDLATLVKTAKANSNGQINAFAPPQQPVAGPSGTNALSSTTSTATTSPQERPSASPVVTVRGHGSPRSRVSSDSGSRRYTPTLTTVSSLQAAMDMPRTRAVSTRSDSGTSFVHVNSNGNVPLRISSLTQVPSSNSNGVPPAPSTLSTIPDSDLGTVTSVWSGGSTSRKSKKLTKGGGDENSISSAMRKTSGFFRKTFGSKDTSTSSAASSSRPPSSLSIPSTPTFARFSSYTSTTNPPVPSIPSAYAQATPTRQTSPNARPTTASSSTSARMTGRQSRSSSQVSKTSPSKSLGRFSNFAASFRSNDTNRSTTDLQNSITSSSSPASPSKGNVPGMKASTSTQSTEQDRLARELYQWQGYEQNLEMLAPQEGDSMGDTSVNTVKGRASISSRAGSIDRPPIPQTPPQVMRDRSRSNSAAGSGVILMSGSIPSPQMSSRSPRPSNPDMFFVSGSIPSPQQAQKKFQAANGTSDLVERLHGSPGSARSPSSLGSSRANGVRTSEEKPALYPVAGKQIRKRSTSSVTSPTTSPLVDEQRAEHMPTVRLVNSPPSASEITQRDENTYNVVPPTRKASIGLGFAMGEDQLASSSAQPPESATQASPSDNALSPIRSRDIPRLVTQSPSPAHARLQNIMSNHATPSTTRTSSYNSAAVPATPPLDTSASSLPVDPDTARSFADRCWNEDETFLKKEKIAEWLGGHGAIRQASLSQYMQRFDFKGLSLEMAFRRLCEKLYLRAETQQIDRILAAFSGWYLEENPDTIFKTKDIVHAVTYAMLLLNTDLHVADVANRMSRSDFILNTMSAIRAQEDMTPSIGTRTPGASNSPALYGTNGFFQADTGRAASSEQYRDGAVPTRFRPKRSGSESANSSRTGLNNLADFSGSSSNLPLHSPAKEKPEVPETMTKSFRTDSQPNLIGRAWEQDLENALREIYSAVRSKAIMQPLAYSQLAPPSVNGSPYSTWNGSVNRTPSRRSQGSLAGNDRSIASKRTSIRGFLGASHESLRATSPTPSVGTSMSGGNFSGGTFGSALSNATSYYPATMGFASNLTHTIIKEQQEDDAFSEASDGSTSDEELALLGAPWAKEGILQRKHYWEMPNKRSKDKHWLQVFAVISKGEMKMFQFGGSGAGNSSGGGVGGGNWLTNAQAVGEVPLAHSLSSAMPPPGYNRSRPHVFVLTLAAGGSYFFQAGTEDLVNEWVLTCNYWAGRTSREPLLGGVSNMDYGWNKVATGVETLDDTEDLASVRSGRSGHSRRSKISYVGSVSRHHGIETPADRANIFDWRPPQAPTGFSTLSEDGQYDALQRHTRALQNELERHNDLRQPMLRLYSPRSANAAKATANWERKSKYLLAELVKYQTYVEALRVARQERQKRRDEKQVTRLLEEADDNAALGDPTYVPEADTTVDTFSTNDTSRQAAGAEFQEPDSSYDAERTQHDAGPGDGQNRFSATTASTTGDFFEANDGRASTDVA